jgi:putative polyhydroxyalkanoate system protein
MSRITINRKHSLTHDQAQRAAESVAEQLKRRFKLRSQWEGDSLHFKHAGLKGQLELKESEVQIRIKLGLMMLALKPFLEQEIHLYMNEIFEET